MFFAMAGNTQIPLQLALKTGGLFRNDHPALPVCGKDLGFPCFMNNFGNNNNKRERAQCPSVAWAHCRQKRFHFCSSCTGYWWNFTAFHTVEKRVEVLLSSLKASLHEG